MNKKIITWIWITYLFLMIWIFVFLIKNDYISSDLTNTYILFQPKELQYNAPSWYLEYYKSKELWWQNRYTWSYLNSFLNNIKQ
jgi:hypothetical protein